MVLLGKLVNARTVAREKISSLPLEQGDLAVKQALKLQGQIAGIDLVIDMIFDIMNFNLEDGQDDDNTSGIDTRRDAADISAGINGGGV